MVSPWFVGRGEPGGSDSPLGEGSTWWRERYHHAGRAGQQRLRLVVNLSLEAPCLGCPRPLPHKHLPPQGSSTTPPINHTVSYSPHRFPPTSPSPIHGNVIAHSPHTELQQTVCCRVPCVPVSHRTLCMCLCLCPVYCGLWTGCVCACVPT
jgi:hypothetical protein